MRSVSAHTGCSWMNHSCFSSGAGGDLNNHKRTHMRLNPEQKDQFVLSSLRLSQNRIKLNGWLESDAKISAETRSLLWLATKSTGGGEALLHATRWSTSASDIYPHQARHKQLQKKVQALSVTQEETDRDIDPLYIAQTPSEIEVNTFDLQRGARCDPDRLKVSIETRVHRACWAETFKTEKKKDKSCYTANISSDKDQTNRFHLISSLFTFRSDSSDEKLCVWIWMNLRTTQKQTCLIWDISETA